MKANKKAAILFIIILVLGIAFKSKDANSQLPDNTVFIDPPSIIDEANTLTSFTINISISYIEGLRSWGINLRYNPMLLYTNSSLIIEGPFLKNGGLSTLWAPPRIEEDYIILGCMITGQSWTDGSGTLASITFMPIRRGETTLHLSDTTLNDVEVNPIPHTSQGGYFRNIEQTQVPKAGFSYVAQAYNVTFNASPSYSPVGVIQNYLWFWGGGSLDIRSTSTTSPVIYHLYPGEIPPKEENATIRLILTDSNNVTGNVLVTVITFGIATHDVAILSVQASPKNVIGNYSTTVNVVVSNKGNQLENTTVTISYNATFFDFQNITATQWTTLHTEQINTTAGLENRTITYFWNTTGYPLGFYAIKAEASPVQGEENTTNNILIDSMKIVTVLYSPVSSFDFGPAEPAANQEVTFNASSSYDPDGTITSYNWDFGDSSTATTTDSTTTHTYIKAGTYIVTLTVTDDNALGKTSTQSIIVHKLATTIALSASSTTISVGSTVTLSGKTTGIPSPVNVTVSQRIYGPRTWNPIAYLETDQAGFFSYNWSPTSAGTYQFKAEWNGDDAHEGSKSNIITITAKYNSTISLSTDKTSIQLGEAALISGHINPAGYGAIATIEYTQNGESWNLIAHILTDENGEYKFNWHPNTTGTYELRAKWSGDDQTFGSQSTTSTININENTPTLATYAPYLAAIVVILATVTILVIAMRRKQALVPPKTEPTSKKPMPRQHREKTTATPNTKSAHTTC